FVEAYKQRYGMEPRSGHSLVNYVGANAFLDIIEEAGSTDADKVRAAVLAYKRPVASTATGWGFDFAENGQNQAVTTTLLQWQDGQVVTVLPGAAGVAKANLNQVVPNTTRGRAGRGRRLPLAV